jgi:hemerythrin-like domain-containing protein
MPARKTCALLQGGHDFLRTQAARIEAHAGRGERTRLQDAILAYCDAAHGHLDVEARMLPPLLARTGEHAQIASLSVEHQAHEQHLRNLERHARTIEGCDELLDLARPILAIFAEANDRQERELFAPLIAACAADEDVLVRGSWMPSARRTSSRQSR